MFWLEIYRKEAIAQEMNPYRSVLFGKILNSRILNGFGIFGSDEAKSGTMKGGE
ncbi:hypothetical protein [Coleofasciculus sp. FACHB-1120]|uniref:hypothetical protein n=1 Tax=Coleofasciculus sp. FACHB-1120 TaxID=2692783 RepID=UPI001684927C|nr:hypothetical protein [Coleofasciculus sp. FACHB-1120]MBD2741974.1 hypothetical protein [Coleofasciculus sp. FACHB-1120]